MKRVVEPELMDDDWQALAYANANFEEAHSRYVRYFQEMHPDLVGQKRVLDLGCGPADITIRFATAYPDFVFNAVDGSAAMLKYAKVALDENSSAITERIFLIEGYIPDVELPHNNYDIILATSFLHQLHNPQALWQTVQKYSRKGTVVFIADLYRPKSLREAQEIVDKYSGSEPEILKRDFYNSLLAAFTVREVQNQLRESKLNLSVKAITDRHLLVTGII